MGPTQVLSFCAFTTAWLALGSMGPSPHLWFLHAKQRLLDQSTSLFGYQTSLFVLCMRNSVICTRIKRLYGFQLSPVVLCMQNSDFRTRITSLWRRIDPTCCFCNQNNDFWTRITSLYGSQTSPVIFCLQNSVPNFRITSLYGSQSSSVFLHSKRRLLDPNNKSLWVPDITCRFVQAIQRD